MNNSSDELVWHYTTLEALGKILDSQSFLATEAGFQNDPAERSFAEVKILEALQRAKELKKIGARELENYVLHGYNASKIENLHGLMHESRFLFCASTDSDNMFCWRTYAAGGDIGCAIGIDPKVSLGVQLREGQKQTQPWTKVSYLPEKLNAALDTRIEEILALYQKSEHPTGGPDELVLWDTYESLRNLAMTTAKSASYADEKECRITIEAPHGAEIIFGQGRAGPRPRVPLIAFEAADDSANLDNPSALPIQAIRLSPTATESSAESLRWLLSKHGYSIDGTWKTVTPDQYDGGDSFGIFERDRSVDILLSRHRYRDV